jgi:hypothetical protein
MDQRPVASTGETPESGPRGISGLLRLLIAGALAALALGTGATTVLAYGAPMACGGRTEAPVFSPWGDQVGYFLMPNGGFENGSTDWSLSGEAKVVSGNESYDVGGPGDSYSLRLPPGSSAESLTVCVSSGEDAIRLFVRNPHVPGAILHVDAIARNPTSGAVGTASFDVNGDVPSPTWAPTMQLKIPRMFGGYGTEELTLLFTLRGTPATWGIDDVYVDPFKSY